MIALNLNSNQFGDGGQAGGYKNIYPNTRHFETEGVNLRCKRIIPLTVNLTWIIVFGRFSKHLIDGVDKSYRLQKNVMKNNTFTSNIHTFCCII